MFRAEHAYVAQTASSFSVRALQGATRTLNGERKNCSFFSSAACSKIRPSDVRNHLTQAGNTDVSRPQRRGRRSPCFTPSHRTTRIDFHHSQGFRLLSGASKKRCYSDASSKR